MKQWSIAPRQFVNRNRIPQRGQTMSKYSVLLLFLISIGYFAAPVQGDVSSLVSMDDQKTLSRVLAGESPKTLDELKAMDRLLKAVAAKVMPTIVAVQIGPAQGSGVVIDKKGHILTAGHVAGKPKRNAVLTLHDGTRIKGKTLGMNRHIDSGLMQITTEGDWQNAEMGDSSKLKVGQWCVAVGHPGGYQTGRNPVVRLGRILSIRDEFIKTDCTLVGGDSGGALFDLNGDVIGIHSRIGGELSANIHVPVSTFHETWDRLAAGEDWGVRLGSQPYIGVQGEPDSDVAKIAEVVPDQPAAKAGVKTGDIIVEFNGKKIEDFSSLAMTVGGMTPGDHVKIVVDRDGETVELELVIGVRSRRG